MNTLLSCSITALVLSIAWPLAAARLPEPIMEPTQEDESKPLELHDFGKISTALAEQGGAWKAFIDNKTLTTGVYRLKKGATDGQSPHTLDEIYYVVKGKARFECEDETVDVRPGSVLFVAAHAEHRFLDIEEDLELLVFFSKVPVPKEEDGSDALPVDSRQPVESRIDHYPDLRVAKRTLPPVDEFLASERHNPNGDDLDDRERGVLADIIAEHNRKRSPIISRQHEVVRRLATERIERGQYDVIRPDGSFPPHGRRGGPVIVHTRKLESGERARVALMYGDSPELRAIEAALTDLAVLTNRKLEALLFD